MDEITLSSYEEFQQMIDKKDFILSEKIVNNIIKNINSDKNFIHLFSINIMEEDGETSTYDINLEKSKFAITLKENLPYFIEREKYEKCNEINEIINKLEKI